MNTVKYTVTTEPPIDIEISANDETHHISFYLTGLAVREKFYQTYVNLKNFIMRKKGQPPNGDLPKLFCCYDM